jgi:molybdopterin-guanine dinucleotide biosynthesis protein A
MMIRGFVQAGGSSTRFGTDKALVPLAGKTMLQRTGELLAGVGEDVTIVGAGGKYAQALWPVLADRWPGEGPLGGILTALESMGDSQSAMAWALIVSCDMPFLTREFLVFLRETASRSKARVVVPESVKGLEPLCACWNIHAAADVRAAFDAGVRKVTDAMKRLPMEVLDESAWKRFDTEGRLFWNMNTPADFEAARRILEATTR